MAYRVKSGLSRHETEVIKEESAVSIGILDVPLDSLLPDAALTYVAFTARRAKGSSKMAPTASRPFFTVSVIVAFAAFLSPFFLEENKPGMQRDEVSFGATIRQRPVLVGSSAPPAGSGFCRSDSLLSHSGKETPLRVLCALSEAGGENVATCPLDRSRRIDDWRFSRSAAPSAGVSK